ncbi:MAG: AI-2E family transporter, partial [Hyphomicrobiaceae bacterium]
SLTASLAGYKDNLTQKVRTITGSGSQDNVFRKAAASVDALEKELKKEAAGTSPGAATMPTVVVAREVNGNSTSVLDQLQGAFRPLATAGLTLLFCLFLLAQHQDIRDRVVRLAGTDNMTDTTSALSEAGTRLSRLFLRQAALNAGFGVFIGIALAFIGVPNAALWGIATCFLRFVPFIGSIIAAVPPVLLAAAVDPGWGMVIATSALFLVGEPIIGHVIEPQVLGKGVGLSPFAMIAAASFWTMVWGPIGLILAAPLTMAVVVLGQYIPRLEFMSILLGDTPALAPEQEFYHRLLTDDAAAAAQQLEDAAETNSIGAASDGIALPALRIAARDYRNDRLDAEQTNALRDTMDAVVELMSDAIGSTIHANASDTANGEKHLRVIVVPARGPIDTIAAKYVAAMLTVTTRHECSAITQA